MGHKDGAFVSLMPALNVYSVPPSPLFLKGGGGGDIDYLPWRGESEKLKKVGSMVQGQVFLKGGLTLFLFNVFKGLSFLHLEITLPFAELCYAFEELFFLSP